MLSMLYLRNFLRSKVKSFLLCFFKDNLKIFHWRNVKENLNHRTDAGVTVNGSFPFVTNGLKESIELTQVINGVGYSLDYCSKAGALG